MQPNLRILIIEDNQTDADLIQRELKKNGLAFIAQVVQTRDTFADALLNFTAFRLTQSRAPHVPFIIVSGILGDERAVDLIKAGVTDYVLKDKLFLLMPKIERALKEAEELKQKTDIDAELKRQHETLLEIAFLQSHQVRVPVAHILGLFELFEFDKPTSTMNTEIFGMLKSSVEALDRIVIEILQKTSDIRYPVKQA